MAGTLESNAGRDGGGVLGVRRLSRRLTLAAVWAVAALSAAALLTLDLIYLAPKTSGLGFLLVLTGLPVYFAWRGNSRQ